ncbi:hypothetical protein HDU96_010737 [Phlyctochytrium bullatum]|nr:hypothetical protein HDU96_010737 [Phlyctochytrium bullatum]
MEDTASVPRPLSSLPRSNPGPTISGVETPLHPSADALDAVTTPTSSQHVHVPLVAVSNGQAHPGRELPSRSQGLLQRFLSPIFNRSFAASATPATDTRSRDALSSDTPEDIEAGVSARSMHPDGQAPDSDQTPPAAAPEREKGQCWCCWEASETATNPLIRVCLGCKDRDLQYIHQECVDRWVTALPAPRTPPPHFHNCSRCGDPYEVETTPVPRIYVLLTDPFLRFAMVLMLTCIAILTVCCVALIAQHWGTGLNIVDFGPWFRIRMTTFAACMLVFCHSINFTTCWMVWEHCGGEVQKHVIGVLDEDLAAFEAAERAGDEDGAEAIRKGRADRIRAKMSALYAATVPADEAGDADEGDDQPRAGNDDEPVPRQSEDADETAPLLGTSSNAARADMDDDEDEEDGTHRVRPPAEPPLVRRGQSLAAGPIGYLARMLKIIPPQQGPSGARGPRRGPSPTHHAPPPPPALPRPPSPGVAEANLQVVVVQGGDRAVPHDGGPLLTFADDVMPTSSKDKGKGRAHGDEDVDEEDGI